MSLNITSWASSVLLYRRLVHYALRYRSILLLAVLGTLLQGLTEAGFPALVEPIIDRVMVQMDPEARILIPLAMIGLFVFRLAVAYVGGVAMASVSNKIIVDIRTELFARLQTLPTPFFDAHATGRLISKITYDVPQVTTAATTVLVTLVKDGASFIGLVGFMFYVNWRLTLIALAMLPIAVWAAAAISKRLRGNSTHLQDAMGELTRVLEESIAGQKVVKIFGGQGYEQRRLDGIVRRIKQFEMKLAQLGAANGPLVQLIMVIPFAIMVYVAGGMTQDGSLTAGEFGGFLFATIFLQSVVKRLADINPKLQKGLAAAESAFSLIDAEPETDIGQKRIAQVRSHIRFENLAFHYDGGERPALERIDLDIRPGHIVALVGQSGSGKTTLAHLLPRFYDPTRGRITLDGIDIRALPLAELRARIALVDQDIVLFNDTVAANIAYGPLADAPRTAVVEAARAAHALDFIEKLPQGLDTLIGERGARLSGGQRQRLAIARAVLKDAPILILDEATSALDTESERCVQAALENLERGRTTLVIAHRLSTIEKADRIVVMDRGRIVETGTHAELIGHDGVYAKLHAMQFQAPS